MTELEILQQRIEYLSTQVERLIDLHQPYPSKMTPLRKAAMLTGQSFTQEAHARKILAYVSQTPSERTKEITNGLLPLPEKTQEMLSAIANDEHVSDKKIISILATVVSGGESGAQQLYEAWKRIVNTDPK